MKLTRQLVMEMRVRQQQQQQQQGQQQQGRRRLRQLQVTDPLLPFPPQPVLVVL
jgi:hypothetical protein